MLPRRTRIVEHALPGSRLHVFERAKHPHLARLAHGYYGHEERSAAPLARSEFANAGVVMILELGPPLRVETGARRASHRGGFVAGLHDGPTRTEHDGHQAGVQVNLPPLAARLVLGVPLAEIAHRAVAAAHVLAAPQGAALRRLAEAESWNARLDAVEALLAGAAERPPPASFRERAFATGRIERSAGRVRIRALSRELGWSERRLERAFAEHVGVSPKLFARLVRFEALMAGVRRGAHASWASAAHALGYADQSHLVRDVKQFAGVPPSAAARRQLPQEPAGPR